jgi:hypothetical protein
MSRRACSWPPRSASQRSRSTREPSDRRHDSAITGRRPSAIPSDSRARSHAVGGTSFDLALITDGNYHIKNIPDIGRFLLNIPLVQIDSVGSDPEDSELLRLLSGRVVKDNRCVHLPSPAGEYDVYVSLLRGGHGLGDVLERDPAAVEADVEEGHLLPRYAERIYGVVPGDPAGTELAVRRRDRGHRVSRPRKDVLNFPDPTARVRPLPSCPRYADDQVPHWAH